MPPTWLGVSWPRAAGQCWRPPPGRGATPHLRGALPPDVRLVVTDLNEPMLEHAKHKFGPHDNVEFRAADAARLPYSG